MEQGKWKFSLLLPSQFFFANPDAKFELIFTIQNKKMSLKLWKCEIMQGRKHSMIEEVLFIHLVMSFITNFESMWWNKIYFKSTVIFFEFFLIICCYLKSIWDFERYGSRILSKDNFNKHDLLCQNERVSALLWDACLRLSLLIPKIVQERNFDC